MDIPKKLEGLAPRRKAAGMTQQQVADALGVERATVGMWETGTSWPSARVLPALAGLLCCSIDDLYTAGERIATAACAQTSLERRTLSARQDARNDNAQEIGGGRC